MLDDGHDEARRCLRGDSEMHALIAAHETVVVMEASVYLRVILQGIDHRLRKERQQGQFTPGLAPSRIEFRAQLLEVGHIDLFDIGEMRDAALRVLHAHGDSPAKANDLDVLCPDLLPPAGGWDLPNAAAGLDV